MDRDEIRLPMVEIFSTVEGEGAAAGFPTTFIRLFHCNLRCVWCDTPYSYAPAKPVFEATIAEIVQEVRKYPNEYICLTGGEPLIHGEKSRQLISALAEIDYIKDIHIETNGAIDLQPFQELREENSLVKAKTRFVLDFKLPTSGELDKMIHTNFSLLEEQDEIKFVIGNDVDFEIAKEMVEKKVERGTPLFSPVFETMQPALLVEKMLANKLSSVKLSLQTHKFIWHPEKRGV
ncbi:7-carboxy-7-deazaguanine synthase [Croceifilum oryzae]|uniref:7-carboxy-7-deazaguanine synthase n=1 Tax=Croceifilum oryzae TaxID=1553429 RepID=A0AAJ1WSK9_9BACL|nr:radical SAM protein [Croceifilum oryzae]MDQ0416066.1 7-carboxy-7-deazaguanine synthase [Croceifilum oryzae]